MTIEELERAAEDIRDLALALARRATDSDERVSLDDVLNAYGHTRASLSDLAGDE